MIENKRAVQTIKKPLIFTVLVKFFMVLRLF